jgi:hypothetical protein
MPELWHIDHPAVATRRDGRSALQCLRPLSEASWPAEADITQDGRYQESQSCENDEPRSCETKEGRSLSGDARICLGA